jgi:two-component system LytT family response regulator
MINILILEDEEYTRKYLAKLVMEHPEVTKVTAVATGEEAVEEARARQPEAALLDIELSQSDQVNGIKVAEEIAQVSPATRFVFVTGYARYALQSFTVHPFDYLLKPVDRKKLADTLTNLAAMQTEKSMIRVETIPIRGRHAVELVPVEDIIFCEKIDRKTVIHTPRAEFATYRPLHELESALPAQFFIRTHKSFVVNLNMVASITEIGDRSYSIGFRTTGKIALMSKNFYPRVKQLLFANQEP